EARVLHHTRPRLAVPARQPVPPQPRRLHHVVVRRYHPRRRVGHLRHSIPPPCCIGLATSRLRHPARPGSLDPARPIRPETPACDTRLTRTGLRDLLDRSTFLPPRPARRQGPGGSSSRCSTGPPRRRLHGAQQAGGSEAGGSIWWSAC